MIYGVTLLLYCVIARWIFLMFTTAEEREGNTRRFNEFGGSYLGWSDRTGSLACTSATWPIGFLIWGSIVVIKRLSECSPIEFLNILAKEPNKIEPIRNYTKLLLATIKDSTISADKRIGP